MTDLTRIAEEYLELQSRKIHPEGTFDTKGRWTPDRYLPCCVDIRTPSAAWPYSEMLHCRTMVHVAHVHGVDLLELRRAVNRIRKGRTADAATAVVAAVV